LLLLAFQPATVTDVQVISGPGVAPGTEISAEEDDQPTLSTVPCSDFVTENQG
jgi:hypothetical protein